MLPGKSKASGMPILSNCRNLSLSWRINGVLKGSAPLAASNDLKLTVQWLELQTGKAACTALAMDVFLEIAKRSYLWVVVEDMQNPSSSPVVWVVEGLIQGLTNGAQASYRSLAPLVTHGDCKGLCEEVI